MVIRDNPEDIKLFFSECWKRSDLVITTGGLGPTTDDLTRESIAQALDEELVYDSSIEKAIRDRFQQLERAMPENNLRVLHVFQRDGIGRYFPSLFDYQAQPAIHILYG